ncbi:DUF4926 domain-containing protein [Candidatus Synechococcus calcipolaris G9]|uniref:DUF4926 domain-containing protein n=1 Tax=Candidatus Synechococcus calcipolaris G9 TaxID=1497997 RepID=A0ABT6EVR8_9SYNE|nr:DUF4926 domain-containing protein [Candidatus Synechococcus calcipolaris]MDG2989848.1 DUF4926 domain-containing protein [Candidatus Synechococcus calcipolaris G9]
MKLLDIVALVQDFPELGLYRGNVGTIVEEYEPGVFEVEFSDTTGRAYTIQTLHDSQLMPLHCGHGELRVVGGCPVVGSG